MYNKVIHSEEIFTNHISNKGPVSKFLLLNKQPKMFSKILNT